MKYLLSTLTLFIFLSQGIFAADIQTNIGKIQSTSGYTGTIPNGGESKGFVGQVLSDIFWATGLIRNEFITAFQAIEGNFSNNIPKWDGGKFIQGIMDDDGTTITVGGDLFVTGEINNNGTVISPTSPWPGSLWSRSGSSIHSSIGNVGIGTSSPVTELHVIGKIGATEYCDENGINCFTAAQVGSGAISGSGGVSTITLGTSTATENIASPGVQCIPSIVKNTGGNPGANSGGNLSCEYNKVLGDIIVNGTGICGYICDSSNIATYTEYTVFRKDKAWGGAKWIGSCSNQRVSSARASCNLGDVAIAKRTAYHSGGMNEGNSNPTFNNEYNSMSSVQLDANGVAWVDITNGDNFSYQRSYNCYNRRGTRGSYAVAEVKCIKED